MYILKKIFIKKIKSISGNLTIEINIDKIVLYSYHSMKYIFNIFLCNLLTNFLNYIGVKFL